MKSANGRWDFSRQSYWVSSVFVSLEWILRFTPNIFSSPHTKTCFWFCSWHGKKEMEGWQGRPFGTWWGHGLLCWQVHVFATNCAEDRRKYHGGHAGNREQILARILWNYGELMWNPKQKPLEIKRVTQYNLIIEKTFEDPWESVKSQVLLFSFLGSRHRLFWPLLSNHRKWSEAQSGLTTQQLVARMYLLNDVPWMNSLLPGTSWNPAVTLKVKPRSRLNKPLRPPFY